MDIRSAAEWDPHIGVLRRRYAEHEGDPAAQTKPIHHLGTVETREMVAAPDEEKNPFLLRLNGGPDRDTMSPIKSPARVGTLSTPGIIFLGKGWPTLKAHATGPLVRSCVRLTFFPPSFRLCCCSVEMP